MNKEIRLSNLRFNELDNEMVLEGYAIVFDSETLIGDETRGFLETIDRNALATTNIRTFLLNTIIKIIF